MKQIRYNRQTLLETTIALALVLLVTNANSQVASPYSRYGLGYVESPVFSANRGMGDIAAPYASNIFINAANPASYGSLTRTTVEIGAKVEGATIGTRDSAYKTASGSVSHFALAFVPNPKHNSWAISIGILPYSEINYHFVQQFNDPVLGNYTQEYLGKGSLYNVYAGGAYKVKGFSIGANFGYLFGKLEYQKINGFADTAYSLNTRNFTDMNISGFAYTLGLQYQKIIHKNTDNPDPRSIISVYTGAYVSSTTKLNAKISNYWDRFTYNTDGTLIVADTLQSLFNQKAKLNMPVTAGAGIMFGNEYFWLVGVDFRYTNWSAFTTPLNNGGLSDSWKFSFGAQITPKYGERGYLKNIQYRAGVFTGKSEVTYNSKQLSETGGTIGLGFPLKKSNTAKEIGTLNFSGVFGSRGTGDKADIHEAYYRFTFGFVLNDIWFIKRKFD